MANGLTQRVPEGAPGPESRRNWADWIKDFTEWLSFLVIIGGGIIAYVEYRGKRAEDLDAAKKAQQDAAHKAYDDVDQKFMEILRSCAQYPQLDCNSKPLTAAELQSPEFKLSPVDKQRQKVLYTMLIDLFENAIKRYTDPVYREALGQEADDDWPGWVLYYNKFLVRPAFADVWTEIGTEYTPKLQNCLNGILKEKPSLPDRVIRPKACELPPVKHPAS